MTNIKQTFSQVFDRIIHPTRRGTGTDTVSTAAVIPTASNPRVHRRADRNSHVDLRPPVTSPPPSDSSAISILSAAIADNNHQTILDEAQKLRDANKTSEFSIVPLLQFALQSKSSSEVRRALVQLPGVRVSQLLPIAVRGGDIDLAKHLLSLGAAIAPAQISQLRSAALKRRDLDLTKALLLQGVSMTAQQASRLLPTAVDANDGEAVRLLLRQQADPTQIAGAARDGADIAMQDLLEKACAVHRLYHARADGHNVVQTDLDKALAGYDFAQARKLLDAAKTEEGMTDVDLWQQHGDQATAGIDIKRAIMILGDAATLGALAEPGPDLSDLMHKGMRELKDSEPELLKLYKAHPYRSEKHGAIENHNGQAQFKDHETRIVCQDLSTKWLLDRIANDNKFDYGTFAGVDAIRDNISFDIRATHKALIANDVERHMRRNSEFGDLATGLFKAIEDIPRKPGEKERALHLLIETTGHVMAAELKLRYEDGKSPYVVHVFDPNSTIGDRRIEVDDLKKLKNLDLAAMLPTMKAVPEYWGNNADDRISMFHVVSAPAARQNAAARTDTARRLTSRTDAVNSTALFHMLENGYAEDLQAVLPKITAHLATLTREEKIAFLAPGNNEGEPAGFLALKNGHAEAVRLFCGLVLGSGLPPADMRNLLRAEDPAGDAALFYAMQQGHARAVQHFVDAVLADTQLSAADKEALLAGKDADGNPALLIAAQKGNRTLVKQVLDALLASGLPLPQKHALFSATDAQGMPALVREFAAGNTEMAETFCKAALESGLPAERKAELLEVAHPNGIPAFFFALQGGHTHAVDTFFQQVLVSDLPDALKTRLFAAKSQSGTPALFMAAQNGHAQAARKYSAHIVGSTLPTADKIALLTGRTDAGHPALGLAAQKGDAAFAGAFCDAVLNTESSLSPQEKIAILSAPDINGFAPLELAVGYGLPNVVTAIGAALAQSNLSPDERLRLFAALDENGKPGVLDLPASGPMIDAWRQTAASLGLANAPAVMAVINAWMNPAAES